MKASFDSGWIDDICRRNFGNAVVLKRMHENEPIIRPEERLRLCASISGRCFLRDWWSAVRTTSFSKIRPQC